MGHWVQALRLSAGGIGASEAFCLLPSPHELGAGERKSQVRAGESPSQKLPPGCSRHRGCSELKSLKAKAPHWAEQKEGRAAGAAPISLHRQVPPCPHCFPFSMSILLHPRSSPCSGFHGSRVRFRRTSQFPLAWVMAGDWQSPPEAAPPFVVLCCSQLGWSFLLCAVCPEHGSRPAACSGLLASGSVPASP